MTDRVLTTVASEALEASPEERIRIIRQPAWVPNPYAESILEELDYVMEQPTSDRMTGLSIIAPTNHGKTALIKTFIGNVPHNNYTDRVNMPVVYIGAPSKPTIPSLYTRILTEIGHPKPRTGGIDDKEAKIKLLAERLSIKCLVIDDIHNVLAGYKNQQEEVLNATRELGGLLKIPLVLSGIGRAATVIQSDTQIENRFPIMQLPIWAASKELAVFLAKLEATLPLKEQSGIWEYTQEIQEMAGGITGNIVGLVKRAAVEAIKSGEEKITIELIEKYRSRFPIPVDIAMHDLSDSDKAIK